MKVIGSILFNAVFYLSIVIYASLVTIFGLFSRPAGYYVAIKWCDLIIFSIRWLCQIKIDIEGEFPPGSYVILSKHQSTLETIVIARHGPNQTWVAKRQLMFAPFFGWGFAVLNPIMIDRSARGKAVKQILAQGADRLARGINVTIFPEGTRLASGKTKRFGVSGVLLAKHAGVPVLPVAHNCGLFWPRRKIVKQPGLARFVIGDLISTDDRSVEDINDEVKQWIDTKVAMLESEATQSL